MILITSTNKVTDQIYVLCVHWVKEDIMQAHEVVYKSRRKEKSDREADETSNESDNITTCGERVRVV